MHDSERKTCLGSGRAKIDCRRARGFRDGKGCRDQIMTLMLPRQTTEVFGAMELKGHLGVFLQEVYKSGV